MKNRLMALLLSAAMILSLLPAAGLAEGTTSFSLALVGLTPLGDLSWEREPLTVDFTAVQNDKTVGTLTTDGTSLLYCEGGRLLLYPVEETVPEGWHLEAGYAVNLKEGAANRATIEVRADAGLFAITADPGAAFVLTPVDETDDERFPMELTADGNGRIMCERGIPVGDYVLQDAAGAYQPVLVSMIPFTGIEEDIVVVRATSAQLTPKQATLTVRASGNADGTAAVTLRSDAGSTDLFVTAGSSVSLELDPGEYDVSVTAPDGCYAEWEGGLQTDYTLTLSADTEITLSLNRLGGIAGDPDVPDGTTVLVLRKGGAAAPAEAEVADGAIRVDGLIPGTYTVMMTLPAGEVTGDGWDLTGTEEGWEAEVTVEVAGGEAVILPALAWAEPLPTLTADANDPAGTADTGAANADAEPAQTDMTDPQELPDETAGQETTVPDAAVEAAQTEETGADGTEPGQLDDTAGTGADPAAGPENDAPVMTDIAMTEYETKDAAMAVEYAGLLSPDRVPVWVDLRPLPQDDTVAGAGTATLRVQVFYDGNRDAQMNSTERGLEGVSVNLVFEADSGDCIVASAVSEGEGIITFRDLPAGTYQLETVLPAGYVYSEKSAKRMTLKQNYMEQSAARVQYSAPIRIGDGETVETAVGATLPGGLTGRVWQDLDADGEREDSEPGMPGVLMELRSQKDESVFYQTVTDENGDYSFEMVKPGGYYLRCYLPDGMMFTVINNHVLPRLRTVITGEGSTSGRKNATIERDSVLADQNIGLIPGATVRVVCYVDANDNGNYDEGEQLLPGVMLKLMRQSNSNELSTVYSSADAPASFGALRIGNYKVMARIPEGWHYAQLGTGDGANRFYQENRRDCTVQNVSVTDAGQDIILYLGAMEYASVSGTVYMDSNNSGTLDAGEERQSGMTVALIGEDGLVAGTSTTDRNGYYIFTSLRPGIYSLRLTARAGYAFTAAGDGSVFMNQGSGAGATEPFELRSGEERTGMYAGMIVPAKLSGAFYGDANDNGTQDPGEGPLPGASVILTAEDGSVTEAVMNEDGTYQFDSIMPGTYDLSWILPENSVFCQLDSSLTAEGNTVTFGPFSLRSGDSGKLAPVGALTYASIEGTIFADGDADGLYGDGDLPLEGAMVTLTREDGTAETARTDAEGHFALPNLRPGAGELTLTLPGEMVITRPEGFSLPLERSVGTQTVPFEVVMGEQWSGQVIGAVTPATIEGSAWLDENDNGRLDADEAPLVGAMIALVDLDDVDGYREATTAGDGTFIFEGVVPGRYQLQYTLDADSEPARSGSSSFHEDSGILVTDELRMQAGQKLTDVFLGIKTTGILAGFAWFDQGGEYVAVPGVKITLLDEDGGTVAELETDEAGSWYIEGMQPGDYQIRAEFPDGYVPVEPDDERITGGGQISVITMTESHSGVSDTFTLRMGEDLMELNVGSVAPGVLGDRVWLDENGNGLQDSEDGGIPNVTVHLWRDGREIAATVTDQYGFYCFTELYPSAYTLTCDVTGVMPTVLRSDIPGIISVMGEDGSLPVQVYSNSHNYDADLGYILTTPGAYPEGYGEGETQNWQFGN